MKAHALLSSLVALAACSSDPPPPAADASLDAPAGPAITASCVYTNAFSMSEECRDYVGPAWTEALVTRDCTTARGTLHLGAACSYPASLGTCVLNAANDNTTRLTFPGSDASRCAATRTGCSVFARGMFTPSALCADALGDGGVATDAAAADDGSASGFGVFEQPTRECRPPLAGEPAGHSDGGLVCTWSAISGATEEGRRFSDYASCDRVRTQRPYYPVAPAPARTKRDPRLDDPTYVAELAWVRSQVEASACSCCHSSRLAPGGPANWYLEAPGNWMDSFHPSGLALGAGWIPSTVFGAYPPEQNNGFSRTTSGLPSTDPARMARFFQQELASRGFTQQSFADATPFGGPIYDQLVYVPTACSSAEGIAADGTIRWEGGPARYVYVLDQGSANPGVPPNLDLPTGTRWRVDVPSTGAPVASGFAYGAVPAGASQRFPASGAPAPLVAGTTYYLYVLLDVGVPLARCLFTAGR